MNDALKLLSKCLKPFGYHIREYRAPNLLHLPQTEKQAPHLKAMRAAQYGTTNMGQVNLDKMTVILRVCMRANRNIDNSTRLTNTPLKELTLRCIKSLMQNIEDCHEMGDINLIILDDHSDPENIELLKSILNKSNISWQWQTTSQTGQGASLYEQFLMAKDKNALFYFVEDDYLHEPDGLKSAWNFYKQIAETYKTHCLIYPQEHASLYGSTFYPSYIVASPDRHWRSMRHATHTFITHAHVVRDYWSYFENTKFVGNKKKRKLGSEARTTNKLFKHIPGFSPLKPVAVHLQGDGLLPPFYEWQPVWNKNKI